MSDGATSPSLRPTAARRFLPLVIILAALALGVLADCAMPVSVPAWLAAGGGGLLAWFVLWFLGRDRAAAVVLLLAVACAGGARHHGHWNVYRADELGRAARDAPRPICLQAVALNSPRRVAAPPDNPLRTRPTGERSRLLVSVERVRNGRAWCSASGTTELSVDGHVLGVRAGDRLQIFALFQRPPCPLNPGGFDLAWHRRCDRQLFQLDARFPDAVTVLAPGSLRNWRRALASLRDPCHEQLWGYLRERQAGLASALLLGAREHVDWERTEPFVTTGTIHLLAISGVHVGILALGFWWTARLLALPRTVAIGGAIAFVVVYALLTDARPPVVRAAILVIAFCLARLSARRTSGFNALAAAAVAVIAWNPSALFQAGTQLSFLAVATIYLLNPYLATPGTPDPLTRLIEQSRPWYVRWRKGFALGLGNLFLISAAIWLVTLPLTAYRYHLVSPIALVLNPVVGLPVSVALFAGFGVLVFGWLLPPVGSVCGWICSQSLGLLEWMVDGADRVSAGHAWIPAPAEWWVLGFYGGLAVWAIWFRRRLPARWCLTVLALWFGLGAMTTVRQVPGLSGRTEAMVGTFLAVGHGACTVVELPGGQTLLYDAGSMSAPEATARTIAEFLWSRRITHLDAVLLTHADADHYNALPELLERFSVGAVYVSPVMFETPTPALTALHDAMAQRGLTVEEIYAGDRLKTHDSSRWLVLHPPRRGVLGSDNANSLTLRADYTGRTILLTGDLEPPGMDDLLAGEPIACDVALAPHHGSSRSGQDEFLAWCRPEWVVISAAANEGAAAVTASGNVGARALHTGQAGAVQVRLGVGGVEVRTWRREPW
jgi:competence protein ComEC